MFLHPFRCHHLPLKAEETEGWLARGMVRAGEGGVRRQPSRPPARHVMPLSLRLPTAEGIKAPGQVGRPHRRALKVSLRESRQCAV